MRITITFNAWDKYQLEKSKRIEHPQWFRCENRTYLDQVWEELDHLSGEYSAFTFFMMFVSQNGNSEGSIQSDTKILARVSGLPEELLLRTARKLVSLEVIDCPEVIETVGKVPETSRTVATVPEKSRLQDKTRQDTTKQDRVNETRRVPSPGAEVWKRYESAYETQYGEKPVRNAKQNSHCKQVAERIGGTDAPEVAEFYVKHPNAFYRQRGHPLSLLVQDAEKLRTEWKTGRVVTGIEARRGERESGNVQAVKNYYAKKHGGRGP